MEVLTEDVAPSAAPPPPPPAAAVSTPNEKPMVVMPPPAPASAPPCPYGPQSMNGRVAARQSHLKPKFVGPKYAPVFPVFQRSTAGAGATHPQSMRVHPKGFRIMSQASPLERNMKSYFRLPPQPPKRETLEREKLRRVIDKDLAASGNPAGVVLDGFLMLEATGVQDPLDATAVTICDSNLVSAVAEDLSYFSNLTSADFGENAMPIEDLIPLSCLETLHLHCNTLKTVASLMPGVFPKLHTLNLSFNQLDVNSLQALGAMPLLERLDLSCNNLGRLPAGFRELRSLKLLALENNKLRDSSNFMVLGDLPLLEEVNLNFNAFGSIPRLSAQEADEETQRDHSDPDVEKARTPTAAPQKFPRLAVLGLGANQFVFFEDLYNLVEFPVLQRVVLWGNPIERRAKDAEILCYEMGQRDVVVVFEALVPAKKSAVAFYGANRSNRVVVPNVDSRGLPRGQHLPTGGSSNAAAPALATTPQDTQGDDGATAGSFFMTQTSAAAPPAASGANHVDQSFAHESQQGAAPSGVSHKPTRIGRTGTAGSSTTHRSLPSPVAGIDVAESTAGYGTSGANARLQALAARFDSTLDSTQPKKSSNIRGVISDLRRMLRQPLPQLNRPRYGGPLERQRQTATAADEDDDDD